MSYQLVWFKRDFRCEDHTALVEAAKLGPIRCIYVLEPMLWLQPDVSLQHFEFIRECLQDLDAHTCILLKVFIENFDIFKTQFNKLT